MLIRVRVLPRSSRNLVKEENGFLKVHLTKPAQDNLANVQLISLLAKHLKIKKYQIIITKGLKSREKVVEINA